jgi:hypothetical protein
MVFDDCAELRELIQLSARGELEAFDRLYMATAHAVLGSLRETGTTDVEQDLELIYVSLWPMLPSYAGTDDPSLWLSLKFQKLLNFDNEHRAL